MAGRKTISASLAAASTLALSANADQAQLEVEAKAPISIADVTQVQKDWGEGIVKIGKAFTDGEDFRAVAAEHINRFYAYGESDVLFKPTLASDVQFRGTFDTALSYFAGGSIEEDKGFAIAPYTHVRWESEGILIHSDSAQAMGNYFFTKTDGSEVKVEYSFGYIRGKDNDLKIVLHHSSMPFSGG